MHRYSFGLLAVVFLLPLRIECPRPLFLAHNALNPVLLPGGALFAPFNEYHSTHAPNDYLFAFVSCAISIWTRLAKRSRWREILDRVMIA